VTRPLTLGVTGLNAGESPAPGVGVLRSLAEGRTTRRARRVGLAYDALDAAIYSAGLADEVFMLPYPSSDAEAFRERLLEIHARVQLDVIIPTLDAELPVFIHLAPELEKFGIRVVLPSVEQLELRSKARLPQLGLEAGIDVPATLTVGSLDQLAAAPETIPFPFFVKGAFYGAALTWTPAEAASAFQKAAAEWGLPIIVQAAAFGEEFNVVAMGDGEGNLLGAVPMKKLVITDKGKGWAGVTIRDAALQKLAHDFVQHTRWRGPFELEVMRSKQGDLHLIEVNPRFPAWVHLATSAGINLPNAVVELALGRALEPQTSYAVGKLFIRIAWDQLASITDFEQLVTLGERSPRPGRAGEPGKLERHVD
jgi:carbamoyl-phosphate synthase large subunit